MERYLNYDPLISNNSVSLIPTTEYGIQLSQFFEFKYFNPMQSCVASSIMNTEENIVVVSPTASGKTVLFELAILKFYLLLKRYNKKVIYIAPLKSLIQEKYNEWTKKFYFLKILELTGDVSNYDELETFDIIMVTPEKLDSVSRRWTENKMFFENLELLLIDEIHCIGDKRGSCLEALVTRFLLLRELEENKNLPLAKFRSIALSATIPNIEDIAKWLKSKYFVFGEEYRPCPLEIIVQGYPSYKNDFLFEQSLNHKILDVIKNNSQGKPSLIFCSTRNLAVSTAKHLHQQCGDMFIINNDHRIGLKNVSKDFSDKTLAELIQAGIGFHHAGLCSTDRNLVEGLFRENAIFILTSTTTLALGVNLPAHLVIIKGTKNYETGKGWVQMSNIQLTQLIGRAGRPQFDEYGAAFIMTESCSVQKCRDLTSGKENVESNLMDVIEENLCSAIYHGFVTDLDTGVKWFQSTFLYVRMQKSNPNIQILGESLTPDNIIMKSINEISSKNIVEVLKNGCFKSLLPSSLVVKYYMKVDSAALINNSIPNSNLSVQELLQMICKLEEFKDTGAIRQGDKSFLNAINKSTIIKFPIPSKKISSYAEKAYLLIQSSVQHNSIDNWQLKQDAAQCLYLASRMAGAVLYYCMEDTEVSFNTCNSAITLAQCLCAEMWETETLVLKQIQGIGNTIENFLLAKGISTFNDLNNCTADKLAKVTGRNINWAENIKRNLLKFPFLDIHIDEINNDLKFKVIQTQTGFKSNLACSNAIILIGSNNQDSLPIFRKKFRLRDGRNEYPFSINNCPPNFTIRVALENILGLDYVYYSPNYKANQRSTLRVQIPNEVQIKKAKKSSLDDDNRQLKKLKINSFAPRTIINNSETDDNNNIPENQQPTLTSMSKFFVPKPVIVPKPIIVTNLVEPKPTLNAYDMIFDNLF